MFMIELPPFLYFQFINELALYNKQVLRVVNFLHKIICLSGVATNKKLFITSVTFRTILLKFQNNIYKFVLTFEKILKYFFINGLKLN